jgi:hypothetical protein
MTACHNGVPVEDIELELFKFVSHFINEYDLGENIITDVLPMVTMYPLLYVIDIPLIDIMFSISFEP